MLFVLGFFIGKLGVNATIQALPQAMEEPPGNSDPEFAIIKVAAAGRSVCERLKVLV